MEFSWYDIVGSIGVALIIGSYLLLQLQKVESSSLKYSSLNAIGAILVIISLYFDFNFPAFVVEFFWLLISLFGIAKYFIGKRNNQYSER